MHLRNMLGLEHNMLGAEHNMLRVCITCHIRAQGSRRASYAGAATAVSMVDHRIDGSRLLTKRQAKQQFREGILNSWGCLCAYCGRPGDTLDHVRPRSRGGRTDQSNLVCCCAACNRAKGSTLDWTAWFRQQSWWCPRREAAIHRWLEAWGAAAA